MSYLLILILIRTLIPFLIFVLNDAPKEQIFSIRIIWWYVNLAKSNLWFLWAIFNNSLIVLLVKWLFEDNIDVYFVIAYLFNQNKWQEIVANLTQKNRIKWFIIVVVIYGVIFKFYGYDSYICTSKMF